MGALTHRFFTSVTEVGQPTWQRFFSAHPFSQYSFIYALEQSGSACAQSGWQPYHLGLYRGEQLVALCIGYIKSHSYGEYVFDWSIAEAYQQYGFDYYPKWLSAIPFTPITGPRIAYHDIDPQQAAVALANALDHEAEQQQWSGWRINFYNDDVSQHLAHPPLLKRQTVQFQWRNNGYNNFEHFCSALKSRKRKQVLKERAQIAAQQLQVQVHQGREISHELMHAMIRFYQQTYLKRSGHLGYLSANFFTQLLTLMADHLVIISAWHQGTIVAASLYLRDQQTLYGRYWGCDEQFQHLHFELCYYQGIELCISEGLTTFNSGAQGEHKIARGFAPIFTHSCHRFCDSPFTAALTDFVARESAQLDLYRQQCLALSPFKMQ